MFQRKSFIVHKQCEGKVTSHKIQRTIVTFMPHAASGHCTKLCTRASMMHLESFDQITGDVKCAWVLYKSVKFQHAKQNSKWPLSESSASVQQEDASQQSGPSQAKTPNLKANERKGHFSVCPKTEEEKFNEVNEISGCSTAFAKRGGVTEGFVRFGFRGSLLCRSTDLPQFFSDLPCRTTSQLLWGCKHRCTMQKRHWERTAQWAECLRRGHSVTSNLYMCFCGNEKGLKQFCPTMQTRRNFLYSFLKTKTERARCLQINSVYSVLTNVTWTHWLKACIVCWLVKANTVLFFPTFVAYSGRPMKIYSWLQKSKLSNCKQRVIKSVKLLNTTQPSGPFFLVCHSFYHNVTAFVWSCTLCSLSTLHQDHSKLAQNYKHCMYGKSTNRCLCWNTIRLSEQTNRQRRVLSSEHAPEEKDRFQQKTKRKRVAKT